MRLRQFLIPGLWEVATTAAASFTGAWLWRIHTPLPSIILYYLVWFGIMACVFGLGASLGRRVTAHTLNLTSLGIAVFYLSAFAALGTDSRTWVWGLAGLTGAASGLYWLALYAQAAHSVQATEGIPYMAWLGVVETGAAVVVPPLAAAVIAAYSGILGYRLVFGGAAGLVGLALGISWRAPATSSAEDTLTSRVPLPESGWRLVIQSMAVLGLRDGVLFFVPGLYLFLRTNSALLLGEYLAAQAAVQTAAFWWVGRRPWHPIMPAVGALMASAAIGLLAPVPGVFMLGLLSGATYPAFKIPLEAHALKVIQNQAQRPGDELRLTSQKELALNGGRMVGFVVMWGLVVSVAHPISTLQGILVGWPALALVLSGAVVAVRRYDQLLSTP
ncbi:MAG: hypothetical protein M0Z36_04755 [Thermaerobacter sp.]|nr:hypothetical protein [Thermaerobacter sp.]